MTSMVGPLGALPVGPTTSTTEVEDDVDSGPPWGTTSGSRRSMTIPSTASRHYGTYIRRGGLAAVLRIKLTEVLYVLWVGQ
jgi:hypothetical protein